MKLASLAAVAGCTKGVVLKPEPNADTRQPYYQQLTNVDDVQYFGKAKVGTQDLTVLLDSGSFEVVLFGDACKTCGPSQPYKPGQSPSYRKGNHTASLSFGSGSVFTKQGYDQISIGPYEKPDMAIWEVTKARMPVLSVANFQGIIGIGPPGEPLETAMMQLKEATATVEKFARFGQIPNDILKKKLKLEDVVENERKKVTLLQGMGVNVFSTCLGRNPGSAGWFVLNDTDPRQRPGFSKMVAEGKLTWSVRIFDLALDTPKGENIVGCREGCGGLLDTGTSLFGMTTNFFQRLVMRLKKGPGDCGNILQFPDLLMTINGHKLRFPADSYIGKMAGLATPELRKLLPNADASLTPGYTAEPEPMNGTMVRLSRHGGELAPMKKHCQLLMMDMGDSMTDMGPLIVLGMPFFREYYTSFDLTPDDRSIYVAPADETCRPGTGHLSLRRTHTTGLRKVNLDKARAPELKIGSDGTVRL